jgi:CDP-glucose 4,6-dehydratase
MRAPFPEFYRGKRLFVTGHTGFKGAWLCLWLSELGAKVHGYALEPPTKPSLFEEASVADRLASHYIGDVRDFNTLRRRLSSVQPEIVFHLAAQPLVRYSYKDPRGTYETNVMGTVNLLEAVRTTESVRVCQVITSDKCYENREWTYAYRENDSMGGHDPYSSSKGCAELVVGAYRNSFFSDGFAENSRLSLASVRAGNVIGGGDWAQDRLVPDCIRALSAGQPAVIRHPEAIRPWQHVLEPLGGYLWLGCRQWEDPTAFTGAWNFGPLGSGHIRVRKVVELILATWGEGEWTAQPSLSQEDVTEASLLKLDITKAQSLLGWSPLLTVEEAIQWTVGWYRQRHANPETKLHDLTCQQIHRYMARGTEAGAPWSGRGG